MFIVKIVNMKKGYFYNKSDKKYMSLESIEKELPEIFLTNSMKKYKYPKVEYLSLIGITCCAGSIYVDRTLVDRIIADDELYDKCIEFLCDKYHFYSIDSDD